MSQPRKCLWVLADGVPCGKPTRYKMADDGGEPGASKVRKYEPFCSLHMEKADED